MMCKHHKRHYRIDGSDAFEVRVRMGCHTDSIVLQANLEPTQLPVAFAKVKVRGLFQKGILGH